MCTDDTACMRDLFIHMVCTSVTQIVALFLTIFIVYGGGGHQNSQIIKNWVHYFEFLAACRRLPTQKNITLPINTCKVYTYIRLWRCDLLIAIIIRLKIRINIPFKVVLMYLLLLFGYLNKSIHQLSHDTKWSWQRYD